MKWCDTNSSVLEWGSETMIIPYKSPVDSKVHRYFVDFYIRVKDRHGSITKYLVEIKPYVQTFPPQKPKRQTKGYLKECATFMVNQSKWAAAELWAKDRGWEFIILTEKQLF